MHESVSVPCAHTKALCSEVAILIIAVQELYFVLKGMVGYRG